MVDEKYYKNARLFFSDMLYGMMSVDMWKGYSELVDYFANQEPKIRRTHVKEEDGNEDSFISPKFEQIKKSMESKAMQSVLDENVTIESVGEMFQALNPRYAARFWQIMSRPKYSKRFKIDPLSKLIDKYEKSSDSDFIAIEEDIDPEEEEYIKRHLQHYKDRLEFMKSTNASNIGHAISFSEKKSDEEEFYDLNASLGDQLFKNNTSDGIVLSHEIIHGMDSTDSSLLPEDMPSCIFRFLLEEIRPITTELFMNDFYKVPSRGLDNNRRSEFERNAEAARASSDRIAKIDYLLSNGKFGDNEETNFLLHAIKYTDYLPFSDLLDFNNHNIGAIIGQYIYEKILEDPRNFKLYMGLEMVVDKESLYRGASIQFLKELGLPIVNNDGQFSLNQENVAEIIKTHNNYLMGSGPKHLDFENASEPLIPDYLFEEVQELYDRVLKEYGLTHDNDGTTVEDIDETRIKYSDVKTIDELANIGLSETELSRFKHSQILIPCGYAFMNGTDIQEKGGERSEEEIYKLKDLISPSVLFGVLAMKKNKPTHEALLKKLLELNYSPEELNDLAYNFILNDFFPEGDVYSLSKDELRLIFLNRYHYLLDENQGVLDYIEGQEWTPVERLAQKAVRYEMERSKELIGERNIGAKYVADLIVGLYKYCDNPQNVPFTNIFNSIITYVQELSNKESYTDLESSTIIPILNDLHDHHQEYHFWQYGYERIKSYAELILEKAQLKGPGKRICQKKDMESQTFNIDELFNSLFPKFQEKRFSDEGKNNHDEK